MHWQALLDRANPPSTHSTSVAIPQALCARTDIEKGITAHSETA